MSITIGEALSRRKLEKVLTAAGTVAGYRHGQYKASKLGPDDVLLSWVDRGGAVCICPAERLHGEWFLRGVMVRATQNFAEARDLPRTSQISDEGMRAIQEAMATKKAPAQVGQT